MCRTIEFVAWDGLILVGLILFVIWILDLTDVIHVGHTSSLKHIFIILAAIFIIAWVFTRCCYHRRRFGRQVIIV